MDKEITTEFSKQYPLRVLKNTVDSETARQIKVAEQRMKSEKGISFYCSKRHEYIFIPNK